MLNVSKSSKFEKFQGLLFLEWDLDRAHVSGEGRVTAAVDHVIEGADHVRDGEVVGARLGVGEIHVICRRDAVRVGIITAVHLPDVSHERLGVCNF